jgi:hypothetical protein
MVEVTHEKLISTFVKMRDARSDLKAQFEAKDRKLREQMEQVESFILHILNTSGVESFRTNAGTAYRTESMTPTASDWGAFYAWVKETDGFDFLFRRIKADAVKDYMNQHDGMAPPGVSVFSKYGVTIRRK